MWVCVVPSILVTISQTRDPADIGDPETIAHVTTNHTSPVELATKVHEDLHNSRPSVLISSWMWKSGNRRFQQGEGPRRGPSPGTVKLCEGSFTALFPSQVSSSQYDAALTLSQISWCAARELLQSTTTKHPFTSCYISVGKIEISPVCMCTELCGPIQTRNCTLHSQYRSINLQSECQF